MFPRAMPLMWAINGVSLWESNDRTMWLLRLSRTLVDEEAMFLFYYLFLLADWTQVCAKLYCSNCAKDAMDNASDGRRCKSTCAHIVRTSRYAVIIFLVEFFYWYCTWILFFLLYRFSSSLKTKCWPLCGSVDVMKIAKKSSDAVDI